MKHMQRFLDKEKTHLRVRLKLSFREQRLAPDAIEYMKEIADELKPIGKLTLQPGASKGRNNSMDITMMLRPI